jgi:hypothetical protein
MLRTGRNPVGGEFQLTLNKMSSRAAQTRAVAAEKRYLHSIFSLVSDGKKFPHSISSFRIMKKKIRPDA